MKTLAFAILAIVTIPAAALAQINVIVSGGFSAAYREAIPEFERTTGIKVNTTSGASQGTAPNTIGAQLRRGVPADVVIMSKEGLADLIAEGRIAAGTNVDLAQTPVGLAVRAGMPKPDIRTVDAFKQTLVKAKGVAFTGSTVGIYLTTTLFPRLGIADQLKAKSAIGDSTVTTIESVTSGKAEIAIMPESELHAAGIDFVGLIPKETQYLSIFSAAVVAGSKMPDAAKRLITFLASDSAKPAIKKSGMEPAAHR